MESIEKILEDLTKEQKESILYDIDHVRASLVGLANKYKLDTKRTTYRFNYLFNRFTEKNLTKYDTYYSLLDGLITAQKLITKHIETNK